ncbi:MAG: nucleotidyltransferase domain-containing protein [Thermoplasmata archaeon]
MWIPSWLGETYATLYRSIETRVFTFKEAATILDAKDEWLRVALSRLHKERCVLVIDRGRPRRYQLLHPENFILIASGALKNLNAIRQEIYVNLVCSSFRHLMKQIDLASFALYGSVARGTAHENSDVDILLVSDDFRGSLGSRLDRLLAVDQKLDDEHQVLSDLGLNGSLSFHPLTKKDVRSFPSILLDLTMDAVLLHDEEAFLETSLEDLKRRLCELGAKRISLGEDEWYWDLKPDYAFGEEVVI